MHYKSPAYPITYLCKPCVSYFRVSHRAVALGLDADDMSAIDEFTEELKAKKKGGPGLADTVSKLSQDIGPSDSIRVKVCICP